MSKPVGLERRKWPNPLVDGYRFRPKAEIGKKTVSGKTRTSICRNATLASSSQGYLMEIPARFIIHESRYWVLNHRMDSALPGYLMLSAKHMTNSLAALPLEAQWELGVLQALIQKTIEDHLSPKHLYIGRFGHDAGYSIHFHFIPVYDWVEAIFWQDERYRLLQTFGSGDTAPQQTDGAELMLFIWREFCERPVPPAIQGHRVDDVVATLRSSFESGLPV
ncbi:HIT family protein [Pseudomonas putida]